MLDDRRPGSGTEPIGMREQRQWLVVAPFKASKFYTFSYLPDFRFGLIDAIHMVFRHSDELLYAT